MADYKQIRILKRYWTKLKTFFLSRNVLSFTFFLALSTVFWFINTLEKERETTLSIPIRYAHIPKNILLTNTPESKLNLSIKDKGANLLNYYSKKALPLTIDLNRTFYEKGSIMIISDELLDKVSKQILPTTVIQSISPDTLFIQYEKLSQRVVPIRISGNIELAQQYTLSEEVRIEPAEITVFGPKHILDTLSYIPTEEIDFKDIQDTVSKRIKLNSQENLRFSTHEVDIHIASEMFTEKDIKLPITCINCPGNLMIRTFPTSVNVKFNVGLSRFNEAENIKIILDYNEIEAGSAKQRLKPVCSDSHISNICLSPEEVEFILEPK